MATKANLVIDQGSTFSVDLDLTDENGDVINLNGYTATSDMRKWYTSVTSYPFTCSINTVAGVISLSMTAAQTSTLSAGRYVYDVEISFDGAVSRVIEGIVTVTPNVTR